MGSYCLNVQSSFGVMKKFCEWIVVMTAEHSEYN